jgi:hypothetical protein
MLRFYFESLLRGPDIHVHKGFQEQLLRKNNVAKFRATFLLFGTILHEMVHVKLRRASQRDSLLKLFPPGLSGTKAESGEWLEMKIFGGMRFLSFAFFPLVYAKAFCSTMEGHKGLFRMPGL